MNHEDQEDFMDVQEANSEFSGRISFLLKQLNEKFPADKLKHMSNDSLSRIERKIREILDELS